MPGLTCAARLEKLWRQQRAPRFESQQKMRDARSYVKACCFIGARFFRGEFHFAFFKGFDLNEARKSYFSVAEFHSVQCHNG